MASFKDKIKKNKSTQQQGERVYFPKTLGMYTIENPNIEKRKYQPDILAIPPVHRTTTIIYKEDSFQRIGSWLCRLYRDPIVVNVGTYPAAALYSGTEELMFPMARNGFDKRIPLVGDEFGVNLPDTYDILTPVANEREKLLLKLKGANLSDKHRAFITKELEKIADMDDTAMIRTTHDVRVIPRLFLPAVVTDVVEEEDPETGDLNKVYTPYLVIFEQALTISVGEALAKNKKVVDKYDPLESADYLFSDLEDAVGEPIQIFHNPLASEGTKGKPVLCAKLYDEKLNSATTPLLNKDLDRDIDDKTLLRIIVLEMIGLYPTKDDKDSIEALLKNAIFEEIKASKDK